MSRYLRTDCLFNRFCGFRKFCRFRRFGRCLGFSCDFTFSRLRIWLFERLTGKGELAQDAFAFRIDLHALAIFEFAHQDLLRNGVFDVALNHATQRTRAQQRVEALLREQILGSVVYDPRPTKLMQAWRQQGGIAIGGEQMLLYQAMVQVWLMTGIWDDDPPSGMVDQDCTARLEQAMRIALEEAL